MKYTFGKSAQKNSMFGALALTFLLCTSQITANNSQIFSTQDSPIQTIVGNDLSGINSGITLEDIQTAWEVLKDELEPKFGMRLRQEFYRDLQTMVDDFNRGKLDIIDTTSINYLRMKPEIEQNMAPDIYGIIRNGKKTHRYLLLVRVDSEFTTPRELLDIKLLIDKHDHSGYFYLDIFLKQHDMATANSSLIEIHGVKNYSQAVLGVFFKQAEACMTTESMFHVMKELNPQLGKQLKVLHASPEMLNTVFFFHKDYSPQAKRKLIEEGKRLDKTEYGRQMLLLYNIDRIIKIDDAELKRQYEMLGGDDVLHLERSPATLKE